MFETIHEVAVVTVSFLALALGSVWYSPYVFGKVWQRVAGLRDEDLSYTPVAFAKLLCGVFVGNLVTFSLVAHVLAVVPPTLISPFRLAVGFMVFLGAILLSMVLWERRQFLYGCIHIGYGVVVIAMGVTVLHLWPW